MDEILIDWHRWCRGYQHQGASLGSPIFAAAKTPRGWDTADEIVGRDLEGSKMATVNFHIFELEPVHRTAIQILARNLSTGRSVWTSTRLPTDIDALHAVVSAAKTILREKLKSACIL